MPRNYHLAWFLLITLVFTLFGNTPGTLEQFVATFNNALPTDAQLSSIDFSKLGITITDKSYFRKEYSLYVSQYRKILPNFKDNEAVRSFVAIRVKDYRSTPFSTIADADNPTYMAFALITGSGIDLDNIGNREHIHLLATSYGVTDLQIENGIWQTLIRDWDSILADVVSLMSKNLSSLKKEDKTQYINNVILPYFTLLSRGRTVPYALEKNICASFGTFFPNPDNASDVFVEYGNQFKKYLNDSTIDNNYFLQLNRVLKNYGFQLSMDINSCSMYSLINYKIPIDTLKIGDILIQKRTGLSLLGTAMGQATYEESDIVVTSERIDEQVNDITMAISAASFHQQYSNEANALWKSLGLPLTANRAQAICKILYRIEFGKSDRLVIKNKLLRDIATHELKHKYDELMLCGVHRIIMDAEISAHITEIIDGGIPLYALKSYIQRLEYFYVNVDEPLVKKKLKPLIVEAWHLAIDASNGKVSEHDIILAYRNRYSDYVMLTNYHFPYLMPFENGIIKTHLKNIPVYRF